MARNSIQRKFLPVFLFLLGFQSAFAADVISYTGRLVNANGSPVTGPVNLKIDLFYSGNLSSLKCSKTFGNVPLKNGVFHLNIDYASGDCGSKPFAQIVQEIPDNETMAISVTDESHSKTYSHHAVQAVPLSMLSAAAKTLTAPPAGTPAGHVLKWNGTAWEAAADGGGAGSVTGITAGTGINVTQNVNDYTVSIANGGVGNTQLANGIDRSKLAVGTPNQIVANDNTGVMTSISVLPLGMGGTGATSAADARTNLGLGTAATANIGLGTLDVLSASGINTCQPWEKLSFNLAPVVGWTCVNEYSDTTKLSLTGGTMTGAIDMSNNKITNLGTPTVGTDAATKAYVDTAASAASTSVWSLSGSDVFRTLGKVGIGTNTPQAVLDIASTTSGVLVPRMTTAERDAIASPIAGMVLYNTTTSKLNFYDTAWKEVGVSGAGITSINIGTGLTPSGAFTSGGTIAIAAGGVSNTELAASAVTDAKVSAGANIARAKLASGTANHVLINDASGVMSSEASLAVTRGGTGLTAPGTANQLLGMNNAAGAMEYKNIVGGTGVSVAHTPNTITLTATGAPPTGAAGGDLSGTYPNPTINTVPVSKGGTGLTSLTPRGVLSGDATGSSVVGTACASGQYLGFNVSGDPTCYNVSNITATSFVNGGNDFGGDATLGTNGAGQALNFETAGATKMTIDSTGNVGIGTASPGSKLDVNGDINIKGYVTSTTPSGYLTFAGAGNHATGYIYLGSDNKLHLSGFANNVKIDSGLEPGTIASAVSFQYGDVTFSKVAGVDTYLRSAGQDLRLQPAAGFNIQLAPSTGSVGVGTPTPNEKLTVEGVTSLKELAAAPTATANYGKLYVKSADSKLYFMNDSGVETALGTATTGSVDSSAISDGSIVDADVSATANIAQSKIANLATDLAAKQPLDAELTAVAGLTTDGIMVKNGAGSVITRTIVGAAGRTFVSNGNGATGNPTVDISNALLPSPIAGDEGKFLKTTGPGVSSWSALASGDITTALGFTPINKATDTINSGTFTFGGSSVVRVLDPILPTDAANRQWVEAQIAAGAGNGFVNNGNDFGGNAVLGTNGAGQALGFETAGTTKMTIAADGKVGIGTTAPNEKLTVEGNLSLKEGAVPSLTAGYGKLYVSSADSKLYFMNDSGTSVELGSSTPAAGSITSSMIADGTIVDADISATANIAQSKIANLTTDLAAKQPLDAELTAVAGLSTDGIMVKSGAGSVITRTIVGAAGRTFVSNGNGATGNPTVDISNALLPSPIAGDEGKFLKTTGPGVSSWSALASGDITTALGFTPLNKAGDLTIGGVLDFTNGTTVKVRTPSGATDAANKAYVDSVASSGPWSVSGGNVFRSTGNVGIGTSSPISALMVGTATNIITDYGKSVLISGSATAPTDSGSARILLEDRSGSSTKVGALAYGGNQLIFGSLASDGSIWSNSSILTANTNTGNVGIGSATPRARLDVGGSIISAPANGVAGATKDYLNGNIQYTTGNCGAYALHNLKDGGSYTFVVQGTTAATCSFTAFSDAGTTALTVHLPPDHGATTAGKHTVYSFFVAGTHAYFAWVPGM